MESRFPAMRVLRLGREFYRDKYGMTGSSHVWFPDLGDEIGDLKGAGIFSISLLGDKIRLNVLDHSMSRHGLPGKLYKERTWMTGEMPGKFTEDFSSKNRKTSMFEGDLTVDFRTEICRTRFSSS
ncbi:hypothetical protein AVEN_16271-1 [Araneus ventricosus]|uniref:Uncharacterized protein n=1 Tax=Araneus ventricosus TaxID=182803 RepID=A0A4Y2TDN0_ARAVE|nr:hypothetical protein AVEN_16271-1 [Araneus ventricosus]